jgi:hypothetical protein
VSEAVRVVGASALDSVRATGSSAAGPASDRRERHERGYAAAKRSCRTLCAAYWNIPAMTRRLYPVVARTARQENHR